jgi:hypothetical protein
MANGLRPGLLVRAASGRAHVGGPNPTSGTTELSALPIGDTEQEAPFTATWGPGPRLYIARGTGRARADMCQDWVRQKAAAVAR